MNVTRQNDSELHFCQSQKVKQRRICETTSAVLDELHLENTFSHMYVPQNIDVIFCPIFRKFGNRSFESSLKKSVPLLVWSGGMHQLANHTIRVEGQHVVLQCQHK